jgi:hypothetical protein
VAPAAALRSAVAVAAAIIAGGGAAARDRVAAALLDERDVASIDLMFVDVQRGRPGETAVLRARLRDAAGLPADAPLRLEADGGSAGPPVRLAPGLYSAHVALPTQLGMRRALRVVAAAGRATASVTLPLVAGPAAEVVVKTPADLAADGADHPIWIGVSDSHGNPSPEPPRVEARRGSVGEAVPIATGGWIVHYHPPRDTRLGEDHVRIAAGSAATSATIRLVPMRPVLSLDARGGVVLGTGAPAPTLALEAAAWHRLAGMELGLLLAASWWTTDRSEDVQGPRGPLEVGARRAWFPLTLSVGSRLELGSRVIATVSAGGGGALISTRTTLAGQPDVSEAGWAPVATAGLELALRVASGEPLVAVQGAWIGDPGLGTLRGAARPVSVFLGYRFHAY